MMMLYREEVGKERVRRVANLICAFPFVLADHLGSRVTDNYSHLITRDDLLLLNRVGNRPLALLNTLGRRALRNMGNFYYLRVVSIFFRLFVCLCACLLA